MPRHAALRASDADREAVSERLRQAAAEGRLDPDELEDRLHAALRARTYGELSPLVRDLPAPRTRTPGARTALGLAVRALALMIAVGIALGVLAFLAAWWMVCALVWWALWMRRGCAMQPRRRVRVL